MAIRHKEYVLSPGAFDLIAGNDSRLRHAGRPNLSAIATAAGLDSTTLTQIKTGRIRLSIGVKAALVNLYMAKAGVSRATAEKRLFDFIDISAARDPGGMCTAGARS